jgi:hypothetical protein
MDMHVYTYQLLAGLGADAGGGGGEVGAAEELVRARCGERRDEVVETQKLSCLCKLRAVRKLNRRSSRPGRSN